MLDEKNYGDYQQAVGNKQEKIRAIDERAAMDIPPEKPFYYSKWWLVLWSLLLWPIGLFMLWGYFANMKKYELPRTDAINKDLEDILKT